eukprot:m.51328 g.51328  ORF g.51328 m.51328 type:complete len:124 (+) comp34132_c0_seq12:544-915(+)
MQTTSIRLANTAGESEVVAAIDELNRNAAVNGILLQLPLDVVESVDTDRCVNMIDPLKDVDGLTVVNAGRLARGEMVNTVVPCTPRGCLDLIQKTGILEELSVFIIFFVRGIKVWIFQARGLL